jgi:acetyl esterase/lipase
MTKMTIETTTWGVRGVSSPRLDEPVPVVGALGVPTVAGANRFQTVDLYLPFTAETRELVGSPVTPFLGTLTRDGHPDTLVHVHGGAWRDPQLTGRSIEATVAHAFRDPDRPIRAVASLNYSLSPFPTHPTMPYDPEIAEEPDPARGGQHPDHLRDVLEGLRFLRSLGLADRSYVLSGHSAGACLAFQAALLGPERFGLRSELTPPTPAALTGVNGLYDLPDLVDRPGPEHEHVAQEYETLLSLAFGDRAGRAAASPARLVPEAVLGRLERGLVPRLVVLDQSSEDQLVPMNQLETMQEALLGIPGLLTARSRRATGAHARPWEDGQMLWSAVRDIVRAVGAP